MEKEQRERLKKVVKIALPVALGVLTVKNVHEEAQIKHVSYWEASRSFLIDLIDDSKHFSIRLSGVVSHGPNGRQDIEDIDLYEGFEFSDEDVERFERAFPESKES